MEGFCLQFYVHEAHKTNGKLTYEWLLEKALSLKIHGGSATRTLAGFGKHGSLHEEHFLELASDVPVEVTFYVTEEEQERLLHAVEEKKLSLFYAKFPAQFSTTN